MGHYVKVYGGKGINAVSPQILHRVQHHPSRKKVPLFRFSFCYIPYMQFFLLYYCMPAPYQWHFKCLKNFNFSACIYVWRIWECFVLLEFLIFVCAQSILTSSAFHCVHRRMEKSQFTTRGNLPMILSLIHQWKGRSQSRSV